MRLRTQLYLGEKKPEKKLFDEVRNDSYNHLKPNGGLWTSSFLGEHLFSDWVRWCIDEEFWRSDHNRAWLLEVEENIRVAVVDCYQDLDDLFKKYGYQPIGLKYLEGLNYEKMAEDYDCLHLTKKGESETRLSMPYSLYGFDCECTIFFRWVFKDVKEFKEFDGGSLFNENR